MLCRWSTVNQSHLQQYVTSQFLQIDDACSAYLSIIDPHPETSSALEELCFMVMGFLQKPQFLFHYSKTHDSGNSDIMSSVLHPLLQLVPQLHERRLKRYKADSAFQSSSLSNMASLAIYKEWP
uniref:Neuromedin U n=1 Tax=Terrapene triunguis TaxID=2587831 RepID=A0A674IQE8_9SAUR